MVVGWEEDGYSHTHKPFIFKQMTHTHTEDEGVPGLNKAKRA